MRTITLIFALLAPLLGGCASSIVDVFEDFRENSLGGDAASYQAAFASWVREEMEGEEESSIIAQSKWLAAFYDAYDVSPGDVKISGRRATLELSLTLSSDAAKVDALKVASPADYGEPKKNRVQTVHFYREGENFPWTIEALTETDEVSLHPSDVVMNLAGGFALNPVPIDVVYECFAPEFLGAIEDKLPSGEDFRFFRDQLAVLLTTHQIVPRRFQEDEAGAKGVLSSVLRPKGDGLSEPDKPFDIKFRKTGELSDEAPIWQIDDDKFIPHREIETDYE
ncbi:MAG: hypothetical protein NUW37_07880 [Planctomycetes bacterium]|nr:hypothetical protein [Planctomycetota bacterium]